MKTALAATPSPAVMKPRWSWIGIAVLALAAVITYSNALNGPFIFDDKPAIVDNPSIRSLWPIHKAMIAPPRNVLAGRPVVNLTFAINYAIGELDPRGYHAANLAIHILSACLLFAFLRRALRTPKLRDRFGKHADSLALTAAVLWELHPLLSETVNYTSCRTEGLVACCFFAAFYFAVRAFESPNPRRWYIATFVVCLIGTGCKEIMAGAPILLYLFDATLISDSFVESFRKRRRFYLSLMLTWIVGATLMLSFVAIHAKTGEGFHRTTPIEYARTEFGVIVHYLRLVFWPNPLTVDYDDWPLANSFIDIWPQALFILGLLGVTIYGLVRRKPAALIGAWCFIILAPTSSFIPLGSEVAAERRMYLPLAALVTGLVLAGYALTSKTLSGIVRLVIVIALAVTLALVTHRRNIDYADKVIFWEDALAKRPQNYRVMSHLVLALLEAEEYPRAREIAERVAAMHPEIAKARATLGDLLIGENKLDAAVVELSAAVRLEPDNILARTNRGLAYFRLGKYPDAIKDFQDALAQDPKFIDAHAYLADALAATGDNAGALAHLETAMRLAPSDAELRQKHEKLKAAH